MSSILFPPPLITSNHPGFLGQDEVHDLTLLLVETQNLAV
jgi:hypothetical protein